MLRALLSSGLKMPEAKASAPTLTRREEYAEATRQDLLEAGARAFQHDGFQAASAEAISRAARVTRGAFYHHFADKRALFDAVVVSLQAQAAATISERARRAADVWGRLEAGIDAFLDVSLDPRYRRIVVQEAPVVLGAARFREIEEAYPMALLSATLAALKRRGELDFHDTEFLARMIDALICKLAIMLGESRETRRLRRQGEKVLKDILDLYRVQRARRPIRAKGD
jgi:AcrR family transcriptional regulator